jgi:hypothetical protein
MKNYSLLMKLVICGGIGLIHSPSYAQGRHLSEVQLDAIVKTDLDLCAPPPSQVGQNGQTLTKSGRTDPETIIPTSNASSIPTDRISKTLNGIWRGVVIGDDKELTVDYYWIMDMKRGEGLIIAQRSGRQTLAPPTQAVADIAPKLTYLLCAHQGFIPSKDNPQIHQFTKVSDDLSTAAGIVQKGTGVSIKAGATPSEIWRALVDAKYFSDPRYADERGIAYAGALVKPTLQTVANAIGPSSVSLTLRGEYRGGGSTAINFTIDKPTTGVERVEFIGTTTRLGDYLVSSPGNGKLWKVEAVAGADYDLAWDKVTLGPLAAADVQSPTLRGTTRHKRK